MSRTEVMRDGSENSGRGSKKVRKDMSNSI